MTDTPAAPTTPRTDAGRLLLDVVSDLRWSNGNPVARDWLAAMIEDIEARSTPAETLDVERLAEALEAELPLNPGPYEKFAEGVREGMYRSLAERVAARLRSPESDRV
jgi:hypothetical protein